MFEVTLDHLQAYLAALDALLRHHYLGQQVAVLAVLGGEAVGQVDQFGQGHLLAEHMLVGLEHRLVIAGVAFDAYLAQFEADLFAALRRDLLGTTSGASGLACGSLRGLKRSSSWDGCTVPGNSTAAAEAASIPQPQSVTQRSVHCEGFIIHLGQMTHYRPETIVRIAKG